MTARETVITILREAVSELEKSLLVMVIDAPGPSVRVFKDKKGAEDAATTIPSSENKSGQAKYKITCRYEINEKGQFLLMPDLDSYPTPAPWPGKAPNALTGSSGPCITSGVLFFSPSDTGRMHQLAGLWESEISMPITDMPSRYSSF